jgi:hypothetical protein
LPAGDYVVEWLDPRTGAVDRGEELRATAKGASVSSPSFEEDVALSLRRR